MDFPGRMMAGFIAVILIFIFPLQYIAQLNEEHIDALIDDRTHRFTDDIRQKGYLDKQMYEEYINFLDTTGERYNIEIQDIKPVKGEEYSHRLNNAFGFVSHNEIISFYAHTHTDVCYAGHRHNNNCHANTGNLDTYVDIYRWQGYYTAGMFHERLIDITCKHCGQRIFQIRYMDYYAGQDAGTAYFVIWGSYFNSQGQKVTLNAAQYKNSDTPNFSSLVNDFNALWSFVENKTGPAQNHMETFNSDVYIDWRGVKVPVMGYYPGCTTYYSSPIRAEMCGQTEDNTPVCDRVVTSITATHPNQTVNKGETIITTATATYLDGHTGIVNCTSNFNPNQEGNQIVTLTYTGLVRNAKTTGTITCTVNVTVKPSRTLSSITVLPAEQSIQKYSSPLFSVWASYIDGTNRILNSNEYTVTGFDASRTGTQNVTISYTEAEITESAAVCVNVTPLQRECRRCHNVYELNHDDSDPGCPFCKENIAGIEVVPDYIEITQGESLPVQVIATYEDFSKEAVEGWTSNFNPERVGLQIVTVEYGGYARDITVWVRERLITCPVCHSEYPASESSCPVCGERVVGISVDPQEITVNQYDPISLTVTAYFANGDSRIVNEWSIDRDASTPGVYIATVSYKGVSATVKLNVLSVFSTECPVCGLIYDISKSPKGCPVCSEELVGIEAYLLSGTNLVQLGSSPAIAIIIVFRDEHREFAYENYTLEGFNPNELGVQTVKVIYKEFFTTIILEVVNTLDIITCPNGHVYYKNADGTDPGCPFCRSGNDTGKVIYFDITYTSEIINTIYSAGKYNFLKGNYISVIVIKKDKSLLYKAQKMFFDTSLLGRKRRFVYGGVI